jgi:hypothetical protein
MRTAVADEILNAPRTVGYESILRIEDVRLL